MTMGNYLYRLRCGDRAVDLMTDAATGGWVLAAGLGGLQAGALSVQYEGGAGVLPSLQRIGSTRSPAQITFRAHLQNDDGIGPFLRNLRDVERFVSDVWLHHEEGARDPIYLERRLDEGYSGTGDEVVLFGRGATYYRVLSIDGIAFPSASHALIASGWIPDAEFTLTCDPCPVGKPQFCAEATGWVRFDDDGNIQLWRGGTNLIHNPSFEHATFNTDWSEIDANITDTVEYERVRTGWQACKLVNTHASDTKRYTVTLTLTVNVYAISAYVYTDGTAVTTADCYLYGQGTTLTATTFEADADHPGWYRAKAMFNGLAASAEHGIVVRALKVVYVDDVQLEALPTSSYGVTNLIENPGFETAGAGGADIWANWTEAATDGALADEVAAMYAGAHAAKITAGASVDTGISQTVTVTAESWYLLTWYQRGDGGANPGRFFILDATHSSYIIAATSTGITAASWSQCAYLFQAPAGCISVTVAFLCPNNNGSISYVDSVSLGLLNTTSIYPWSPFMLEGFDPGPGVAWAGTAHDSNQTRTFGYMNLYAGPTTLRGNRIIDAGTGTLSLWVKTPWAGDDYLVHYLLYAYGDNTYIALYKSSTNTLHVTFADIMVAYSKSLSFAVTTAEWPADTWLNVIITWTAGAPTGLYLYGATAASDTSVTTSGDYVPCHGMATYVRLGDISTASSGWDGWVGDVRIFGKDATVTPALLYAAGRGKSELAFLWTNNIRDMDNTTEGSTYYNYGFIANLPGDVPCPCRLILNNPDGADDFSKAYYGIRINGNKTTNLNVFEGTQGTDATDGADAARSNNDRTRVAPAATTEPAAYNVRFTVVPDGRKSQLVYGRYKIVAVVRDGAASTGVFKARIKTVLNSTVVIETGEWVSASRVDATEYVLLDMGTFTIPPLNPPDMFLGQTITQTGDRSAYCYADMYVWMTSGAGLNFDVDCIILFPERISGYIYDASVNWTHGNSIVIDAISVPPRTYTTEAASIGGSFPNTITFDPLQRADVQCKWPILPPHTWCFINQVLEDSDDGHAVDDDTTWLVQYQPVYMWGA